MLYHHLLLNPALPEILLAVFAMVSMIIGLYARRKSFEKVFNFALIAFIIVGAVLVIHKPNNVAQYAFNDLFVTDTMIFMAKILLVVIAFFCLLMGRLWMKTHHLYKFEYVTLYLFSVLGMMMMMSANDFLALYIGLELQSLALYILASLQRDNQRSSESGVKYFILGAVASGLYLYGVSLLYGFSGATSYHIISQAQANIGLIVGMVFIIGAMGFKIAVAPFHMWSPDVYEGAPTPITAFFASVPKIAGVIVLGILLYKVFFQMHEIWQNILQVMAIFSMIIGAFSALVQTNIKRLMAYSSIGHVGFMVAGLASANDKGLEASFIYLTIYTVMVLGCFAVILSMRFQESTNHEMSEYIQDLKGIAKTNPRIALVMMIIMFSMAGIPPLGGFFAKLYVFFAVVEAELYVLAVVAVLCSVVSAFYYLRIIHQMYFAESERIFLPLRNTAIVFTMLCCSVFVVSFIVFVGYIHNLNL